MSLVGWLVHRAPDAADDEPVHQNEDSKGDWEDCAAALKGIADLGTPESVQYLEKAQTRLQALTDAESMRTKDLIGLYLN